jgi:DNA-binding transcriptional MerR regulator
MTIAEASKHFGLSPDTLRYYERIGLIPRVTRNSKGIREYSEMDRNWVQFIRCMRSAGIPVETLIDYVSLFQQGEATRETRKAMLKDQREHIAARIAEMQEALDKLDYKIAHYDEVIFPVESTLQ